MKHKLSVILKKCNNYKYREGFIKYLKSLNYEEFKELYLHYALIVLRYENIYKHKNPKKFSKKWFINKKIKNKTKKLYYYFIKANDNFIKKITNKIIEDNGLREKLFDELTITRNKINNLSKKTFIISETSSKNDIIDFNIYLILSTDLSNKIKELINKIDNLTKII